MLFTVTRLHAMPMRCRFDMPITFDADTPLRRYAACRASLFRVFCLISMIDHRRDIDADHFAPMLAVFDVAVTMMICAARCYFDVYAIFRYNIYFRHLRIYAIIAAIFAIMLCFHYAAAFAGFSLPSRHCLAADVYAASRHFSAMMLR